MPISEVLGDMLLEHGGAQALVNPVNCVGVMGAGLALQFKRTWPDNFNAYALACKQGLVRPGKVFVFELEPVAGSGLGPGPGPGLDSHSGPRWILNLPTKRHWRDASRLDDIEAGLADLVVQIRERGIRSVAIPPLGCGLGGLQWSEVRPRIIAAMAQLQQVRALVFGPHSTMSSSDPMLSLQRSRPRSA